MAKMLVGLAMAVVVWGCETGEEVTGVASATATRRADGYVVVQVKTTCDLKSGMGRVDGNCDSDGDDVCFRADWIERGNPSKVVFTEHVCKEIEHAYRGEVVLTSPAPVPTDRALDIHVYAEDGACGSPETPDPAAACGPTIASP